jgi:aminopeptidase N/puromycin-sensitive aminopeptidase
MKLISALAGLVFFLTGVCVAQRLPEIAVPDRYKLTFSPDFTSNDFAGDEVIEVRVLKPTSQIVMNAAEIDFQEATITSGNNPQKATVTLDKDKQTATLAVDHPIPLGAATIQIHYHGILNDQLRGFYMGKDSDGHKYAATQLWATDARRAFPSFDEPAYKAIFDVTVVADTGMTVISNTKIVSDTAAPEGMHTVHFAPTPRMSSYLVAVVVGKFEYVEGVVDGIPIRVYTSPGKKELSTFALDAAENIMRFYNRYFSIKYPYGKLDLVGLEDFSAGAMENTGCITFRELLLLIDEKHGSVDAKRGVASTIAHEMAHQWFGDLVTNQWWDDFWLNEGFATWMSTKPLEAWKPEWNMQLQDVQGAVQAMGTDSLINTHPMHQSVETPEQIVELADEITYVKTAAVLRMLESYLGPETFRAGVNAYVTKHAYANATAADFWNAQTQVSRKPVDKLMPTFVEQAGPPLVSIHAQCSGDSEKVTLEQRRYFYDRARFEAGSSERWQIPVCMKQGSAGKSGAEHCELLTQPQQSFTLPGCSSWVNANAGAKGYYLSGYDADAVRAMAHDAETALSPAERIALLSDVWASVRVGREGIGDYMAVVEGLQADRGQAVLGPLAEQLGFIGRYVVNDADRDSYRDWVRQVLAPAAADVGWEPRPGESADREGLRAALMLALGYTARDPEIGALALALANRALDDSSSVNHELAFAALRVASSRGDAALYNKIKDRLKTAQTPEEVIAYQQSLAQFADSALLEKTLEFAISPEVRSQDSALLISFAMQNPYGQKLAWDFVRSHWERIRSLGEELAGIYIVGAAGSFCDAGLRDQLQEFFATHHDSTSERTLKQSVERMNYCLDLKTQQGSQLAAWLKLHSGGH